MMKGLGKLGPGRTYLETIKAVYDKSTNIIMRWENGEHFP